MYDACAIKFVHCAFFVANISNCFTKHDTRSQPHIFRVNNLLFINRIRFWFLGADLNSDVSVATTLGHVRLPCGAATLLRSLLSHTQGSISTEISQGHRDVTTGRFLLGQLLHCHGGCECRTDITVGSRQSLPKSRAAVVLSIPHRGQFLLNPLCTDIISHPKSGSGRDAGPVSAKCCHC